MFRRIDCQVFRNNLSIHSDFDTNLCTLSRGPYGPADVLEEDRGDGRFGETARAVISVRYPVAPSRTEVAFRYITARHITPNR